MKKIFLSLLFSVILFSYSYGKINIDSSSLNILERGRVSEFIGNVHITADNFIVTAERAVSRKDDGVIEAYGDVYIKYSSDTWNVEGRCKELKMFSGEDRFIMSGSAKTVYRTDDMNENEIAEVYADLITLDYSGRHEVIFDGNVKAQSSRMTIFSNKAMYLKNEERIEFSDSPRAVSLTEKVMTEYWGDLINLFMNNEKVKISGNARTRVNFKDEFKM